MINQNKTHKQLCQENEELRARLKDAEEALQAIRRGEVDALVVDSGEDVQVFTLQGADQPYRIMVETINEGAATLQADGTILYSNKRLAKMLEVPLENLLGSSFYSYLQPADRPAFEALVRKGLHGEGRAELAFQISSGARMPVLLSVSAGGVDHEQRICLIATDLTEQKRSEEVASAERMARSILEQAAEAIIVCDISGTIIRASQAANLILQESPLYQPFEEAFPIMLEDGYEDQRSFSIEEVLAGKSVKGLVSQLEIHSSTTRINEPTFLYVLLSATPLRNDQGDVLGCIVTLTDITQRRQAEAVLREREMQHRLLDQREKERIQIARNLHDGPLQDLLGLSYAVQAMVANQGEEAAKQLGEIRESLIELAGELRNVCNELRPPILARFGLTKAIRAHTEDFQARYSNLELILNLMEDGQEMPDGTRMALFRIYQECLNNVIHHSNATVVKVILTLENDLIHLEVTDNGSGFKVPMDWIELVRNGHLGLVGMKERAEALGGRIKVHSQPGQGTTVWVEIPWAASGS